MLSRRLTVFRLVSICTTVATIPNHRVITYLLPVVPIVSVNKDINKTMAGRRSGVTMIGLVILVAITTTLLFNGSSSDINTIQGWQQQKLRQHQQGSSRRRLVEDPAATPTMSPTYNPTTTYNPTSTYNPTATDSPTSFSRPSSS